MSFSEIQAAQAILAVLPDSRWIGAGLAQAYIWINANDRPSDDATLYFSDKEFLP